MGLTGRTFQVGSSLITGGLTIVTGVSGGVFLGSGSVFSVLLANISGNAPMWVGGTSGSNVPVSGRGFPIYGGAPPLQIPVNAVEDIKVFAEASGQFISWAGIQK